MSSQQEPHLQPLDEEISNSGEDLDQFLQSIGYGYLFSKLSQLGFSNILELA